MVRASIENMLSGKESRYALVIGVAKRARQIISGDEPLVEGDGKKPLSIAVEELNESQIKIMSDEDEE